MRDRSIEYVLLTEDQYAQLVHALEAYQLMHGEDCICEPCQLTRDSVYHTPHVYAPIFMPYAGPPLDKKAGLAEIAHIAQDARLYD